MLFALASLLTAGVTSAASACCGWGVQAPIAYAPAGCGGCGAPSAAIVYAQPVAPAPPPVAVTGWGGTWGRTWSRTWGTGCSCSRHFVYAAAPAITLTPIAPAPIYVVNQGPYYTGPGIMVPYRTWRAPAYVSPSVYPYVHGYAYHYRYWHRHGHAFHRPFIAPRFHVAYHQRFYSRSLYRAPTWRRAVHRYHR